MAEAHRDEIAKLEALYASNPEGRVFTHLAEAYRKAGDLDLAAQVLEQGLQRHPDSASGFIVLGRVHFDRGERTQAAGAFRRALELDSGNLVAHRLLGELALDQDAPEEALRHYRELLDRNPGDASLQEQVEALSHPGVPAGEPDAPILAEAGEGRLGDETWAPAGDDQPGPDRYGERTVGGSVDAPGGYGAEELPEPTVSEYLPEPDASEYRPEPEVSEYRPEPDVEAAPEQPVEAFGAETWVEPGEAAHAAPAETAQSWEQGMLAEIPEGDDRISDDEVERADLLSADLSLEAVPLEAEEEYADLPPLEVAAFEEQPEYADLPPLETGLLSDEAFPEGEGEDTGLPALEPIGDTPDAWDEPEEAEPPLGLYDEERAAAQEREPGEPEPGMAEAGTGLVTETMAELYRSQGFHARAADVYRSLLRERSEDERLQHRLAEVEAELAAGAERRVREAPDPESVESAFTGGGGAAGGEETPYAWSAADEGTGAGVAIGDYFRSLLSWNGSAPAAAPEAGEPPVEAGAPEAAPPEFWLEQPAEGGWEEQGGTEAQAPDELVLEPADEAAWTPEPAPEPAGDSGWTPDELMREPAEPMPWNAAPAAEAPTSAPGTGGDLMPWELPEPPGLEPAAPEAEPAAREPAEEPRAEAEAAETAAGEAEAEDDEDEDLEMFRSWLQSLKK